MQDYVKRQRTFYFKWIWVLYKFLLMFVKTGILDDLTEHFKAKFICL